MVKSISVFELKEQIASGDRIDLIDVRSPAEFASVHAEGAINVPLNDLSPVDVMADRQHASQALYIICQSGNRSRNACNAFSNAGYDNVVNVEGGTMAWQREGLPVVQGTGGGHFKLAVLFLLIGGGLGFMTNSSVIGAWGLVMAGMTFAGLLDGCPICVALSKIPGVGCKSGTCSR